jgi:hypothetical protein
MQQIFRIPSRSAASDFAFARDDSILNRSAMMSKFDKLLLTRLWPSARSGQIATP